VDWTAVIAHCQGYVIARTWRDSSPTLPTGSPAVTRIADRTGCHCSDRPSICRPMSMLFV